MRWYGCFHEPVWWQTQTFGAEASVPVADGVL